MSELLATRARVLMGDSPLDCGTPLRNLDTEKDEGSQEAKSA